MSDKSCENCGSKDVCHFFSGTSYICAGFPSYSGWKPKPKEDKSCDIRAEVTKHELLNPGYYYLTLEIKNKEVLIECLTKEEAEELARRINEPNEKEIKCGVCGKLMKWNNKPKAKEVKACDDCYAGLYKLSVPFLNGKKEECNRIVGIIEGMIHVGGEYHIETLVELRKRISRIAGGKEK